MADLVIRGGRRLSGRVDVEGNKNAALPLLAACLLTDEECVLTNVPRIVPAPVRIPLPPAPFQGSIYENQTALRSRYFEVKAAAT